MLSAENYPDPSVCHCAIRTVPSLENLVSAMVGMARCAVPARVVVGGMAIRETMAIEGVAPLHAARTSQRDVPAALKTYSPEGEGSG